MDETDRNYKSPLADELIRVRTLFKEARMLGQDERAMELADELHEIGFNSYQQSCAYIGAIDEVARKQTNPEVLRLLGEFRSKLVRIAEQKATASDKYATGLLKLESR